jgi:5-methylcytosine-specific restriction endonuclease McrA
MAEAILAQRDLEKNKIQCREYYQRNKERLQQNARIRAAKLRAENPKLADERAKKSKHKNAEKYKDYANAYYEKHKQKFIEKAKKADKENVYQRRTRTALRRARKAKAGGSYTRHDIERLLISQASKCNGCGCDISIKFEVDHITPISRGGDNNISNIQLLCRPCNAQKWAFTMDEWIIKKGKKHGI